MFNDLSGLNNFGQGVMNSFGVGATIANIGDRVPIIGTNVSAFVRGYQSGKEGILSAIGGDRSANPFSHMQSLIENKPKNWLQAMGRRYQLGGGLAGTVTGMASVPVGMAAKHVGRGAAWLGRKSPIIATAAMILGGTALLNSTGGVEENGFLKSQMTAIAEYAGYENSPLAGMGASMSFGGSGYSGPIPVLPSMQKKRGYSASALGATGELVLALNQNRRV